MKLKTIYHNISTKKGFSLIELLVVISIIGILIALGAFGYATAQKQSRDARRQTDIREIQNGLEQYYAENGNYPTGIDIDIAFQNTRPTDPKNDAPYLYDWDQTTILDYCVCATLENKTGNADAPTSSTCTWNATGTSLCIQNQQ